MHGAMKHKPLSILIFFPDLTPKSFNHELIREVVQIWVSDGTRVAPKPQKPWFCMKYETQVSKSKPEKPGF